MNYVIGDVHGCYKELIHLLNRIESKDPDAVIYFVGDWIDRGPQVADVMKWVVENICLILFREYEKQNNHISKNRKGLQPYG